MDYKIIINNKIIYMSKENYERFIDEVPNTEFLNECEETSKLFSPQFVEVAKKERRYSDGISTKSNLSKKEKQDIFFRRF